jgi:hypothetical protein
MGGIENVHLAEIAMWNGEEFSVFAQECGAEAFDLIL